MKRKEKFKIGLLCGGPSLERGISLNSARSVMDHLSAEKIEIHPFYFDAQKNAYKISKAQLYSNTPSDFDFKLKHTATPLRERRLIEFLRSVDIVFPVIHGKFGEDGKIQRFLEKHNIPFVGSSFESCKNAFDKFKANSFITSKGFFTLPSAVLKIYAKDHRETIERFFKENKIKRAVVKPAAGGSSIGVFSVSTSKEALEKANLLFSKRMDTRVVLEEFAEGIEFTVIIMENFFGIPVALPPTEIETDYTKHQIFDFRKKYLPTRQVTWHCPPRFDKEVIEKIQAQAEQLFAFFKMNDFGRFDGWVLPDGNIWFCDFNPVSGMEQNSFLFQQASRIGMTHNDILSHIVKRASIRNNIFFPNNVNKKNGKRKKIKVLMGGDNSERQVSLMSGTNVWLKLRHSKKYQPEPYLLRGGKSVWRLPYHLCLNHTVEEIEENCKSYQKAKEKLLEFEERARLRLRLPEKKEDEEFFDPQKMNLEEFTEGSRFVFIALHGGPGEDGTLQKTLRKKRINFNGPDEKVSALCMDKHKTSLFIEKLKIKGVKSIPGKAANTKKVLRLKNSDVKNFWRKTKKELGADTLIVKPRADGCTTGIVHLYSLKDFRKYLELLKEKVPFVSKATFRGQLDIIEMPTETPLELLFEKFIETDVLRVKKNKLKYRYRTGWIEITAGVLQENKKIKAFNPSITISEGEVLTVEEKFQGGTGVNITPPPEDIVKKSILASVKRRIEKLAKEIGIQGYSRIDAFLNIKSGEMKIIEINTLPGLTPSTVLYQQALAENPPIFPNELLEKLIENKGF